MHLDSVDVKGHNSEGHARGVRAALVLAVAILAGCLSDPATQLPEAGLEAAGESPLTIDCMGLAFVAFVRSEWVQPKMPPGYDALSGGGSVNGIPVPVEDGVTPIGITTVECDSLVFPDGSEVRDVALAWSRVSLEKAGGYEQEEENGVDYYTFELFFDVDAVPQLAFHFQPFGWPVRDAQVELTADAARIQADDVDYQIVLGPDVFPWVGSETGEDDAPRRQHHVSNAPSYGTIGDVEVRGNNLWSSAMEAQGGFFGTVGPVPGMPLPGVVQLMGFKGPSVLQWAEPADA